MTCYRATYGGLLTLVDYGPVPVPADERGPAGEASGDFETSHRQELPGPMVSTRRWREAEVQPA